MRPVLQNQPQIGSLSQALLESLKTLLAAITAGWNKQHNGDGAHTAVVADSLTAPVVRSQGRFITARICDVNNPAEATTQPLMPGLGVFNIVAPGSSFFNVLRIRTNTAGIEPTVVHGIATAGREEGERILIVNTGNGNLTLRLSSVSLAPVGTQFQMDANLTPMVFGELTIGSAGSVEAIYLHHTFYNKYFWHLTAVREV